MAKAEEIALFGPGEGRRLAQAPERRLVRLLAGAWTPVQVGPGLAWMAADPRKPTRFYVSGARSVYATEDGETFRAIGGPKLAGKMAVDSLGRLYVVGYQANTYWGDMASPLIANGKLYLHSLTGRLYALDASDGKLLWQVNLFKHQMLHWTEKEGNAAGPLLVGGTLIVTYNGGHVAGQADHRADGFAVAIQAPVVPVSVDQIRYGLEPLPLVGIVTGEAVGVCTNARGLEFNVACQ